MHSCQEPSPHFHALFSPVLVPFSSLLLPLLPSHNIPASADSDHHLPPASQTLHSLTLALLRIQLFLHAFLASVFWNSRFLPSLTDRQTIPSLLCV
ncbi:hypothetical protein F5Y12DRAFT_737277 [Xylaria sp. FL1777]|nr:hypothetical protein F5Y12DRAFT_737277 [Xylaria sp. FL1777]